MQYAHTQRGMIHYIVFSAAAAMVILAWLIREDQPAMVIVLCAAALMVAVGFAFAEMTVRDDGDALAIRFGPLPLFSKRIPYRDITSVEPGRTSVLDGWGIHWIPGRGTTYNVWGFDCAMLRLGNRTIRVGSDDVDNLVAFLRGKIGQTA